MFFYNTKIIFLKNSTNHPHCCPFLILENVVCYVYAETVNGVVLRLRSATEWRVNRKTQRRMKRN